MRNIIWFLALTLLLVVQAGILMPLKITPVSLILIAVTMATLLSEFNQGLIITLMGGIILDFTSGFPDGIFTISFLIVFLGMQLILNEFLTREPNRFVIGVAVAGSTLVYFLAIVIVNYVFTWFHLISQIDLQYWITVRLPLMLMWNLIFAYPIFYYYLIVQNLASKLPSNEEPIRT